MTAKERRYVRKLEIRVEELEKARERTQESWCEQFNALFETRTALLQAFAAIEGAAVIMHECIKNDPQYMAEKRQIQIIPDF